MENTNYIGLSLQTALRRELDVVANNIANMSTVGFKSEQVLFHEILNKKITPEAGREKFSMVNDYGSYRDIRQGSVEYTGNPLDIALSGDGYLAIEAAPDGTPRYSRAGNLQLNDQRQIVDKNGLIVLSESDQPITIPPDEVEINIDSKGGIATENGAVGNLKLVRFDRPQFLEAQQGGLYTAGEEPPLPAADIQVQQGSLEKSNVEPIVEMTRMIELQRAYERVSRMLNDEDQRQTDAITRLGRIS